MASRGHTRGKKDCPGLDNWHTPLHSIPPTWQSHGLLRTNKRDTASRKGQHKKLESIIGRIERTSYAVPNAKFFINRLQYIMYQSTRRGWAHIPKSVRVDLNLHLEFIQQAAKGTSINNLVFRSPSRVYYVDSYPFGMGGYWAQGRAWRFYIPPSLRSIHTNNLLEFISQIICIWIDALDGNLPPLSCYLGCSDSTSSVG